MAQDKKGFVLYADQKLIFDDLTNEEAGILIKHIFSYVNDENPALENRFIDMAFKPIKLQLKRDLIKYEAVKQRNSANARKRWDAVASSGIPNDTRNADKDIDIVKDKVIDKDKDNIFNAIAFMCSLGYKESLVKEWFEVRKLKKLKNTETALTGFNLEVLKTGKQINEILKTCVEKSWGGFKAEWLGVTEPTKKRKQFNLDA